MPSTHIVKESHVKQTPRLRQLCGMFDMQPEQGAREEWTVNLDIGDDWNVGLIVGPSGSGKTTVARDLFTDDIVDGYSWPQSKSLVDAFPKQMGIKDITMLLSSVGFSSPPAWMRPFRVLSNGEKFRATMARALAEQPDLCVVDEFTSVVDRTVAQIGSAAIQKAVRGRGQKFIAVTCHYDVVDWLEPDWVYEPHTSRLARDCLQRPKIEITIRRVHRSAWKLFSKHHYLSHSINTASQCFVGFINGTPAVFTAVLPFPHPVNPGWKEHRTVCLPDFQGLGIGNVMSDYIASLFRAKGKPYFSTTTHPGMIYTRAKSSKWHMHRKPDLNSFAKSNAGINKTKDSVRRSAGFTYRGAPNEKDARGFAVI